MGRSLSTILTRLLLELYSNLKDFYNKNPRMESFINKKHRLASFSFLFPTFAPIAYLLLFFLHCVLNFKKILQHVKKQYVLLCLIYICLFLSLLVSRYPFLSLAGTVGITFYIISFCNGKTIDKSAVGDFLSIGVIIGFLLSIILWLSGLQVKLMPSTFIFIKQGRMPGLVGHPSVFGNTLAILLPVELYYIIVDKNSPKMKLLKLISLLCIISGIYLTKTRSALVTAVISSLFLLIFNKRWDFLLFFTALSASGFIFLPGALQRFENLLKVAKGIYVPDPGINERLKMYRFSIQKFCSASLPRKFFGYGLLNFRPIYNEYNGKNPHPYIGGPGTPYIHNVYLSFLFETGIIGFSFLLYTFVHLFLRCNNLGKAILIGFAVNSLFDNLLGVLHIGSMIFAFLGMNYEEGNSNTEKSS